MHKQVTENFEPFFDISLPMPNGSANNQKVTDITLSNKEQAEQNDMVSSLPLPLQDDSKIDETPRASKPHPGSVSDQSEEHDLADNVEVNGTEDRVEQHNISGQNFDCGEKQATDDPQFSNSNEHHTCTPTHDFSGNKEEERVPTEVQAKNPRDIAFNKKTLQQHLKLNNYHHQAVGVEYIPNLDMTLDNCLLIHTDLDVLDENNKFVCQRCTEEKQSKHIQAWF